jgi:hypothetical protein
MTHDELLTLAAQAAANDAYQRAMEAQSARTDGRLGHLAAPSTYEAHGMAAAAKRRRAALLRAQASRQVATTEQAG